MNEQLPSPHEPLVLADGTVIDPSTGTPVRDKPTYIEVPSGQRAQEIVGRTRRRVIDLPEPPKTMNAVSVVLAYTMYGLSVQEICIATGLTIEQVENIRSMEAYSVLEREIVDNILDADSENVRAILTEASHNAARRVTSLLNSQDETIQMAAAKDVLNRTGHSTKDDRRGGMSDGLNIVVTIKDDSVKQPIIEIQGEKV